MSILPRLAFNPPRWTTLVAAACTVGLIAAFAPAGLAAAADAAPAASESLEEVVITGSRILTPNSQSTSPIQVVTSKEILQGGKTDMVDLLNQLPQNLQNAFTSFSNTSSGLSTPGGIATVDLRGLGPQRTLVLVNGRRLGIGDPNTANTVPSPDIDQIPVGLVDHVEVVTGGASAVYGSDALAGVVNFIMKRDFEGIQIDGQFGEYMHSNDNGYVHELQAAAGAGFPVVSGNATDGRGQDFSILMGSSIADGKGNVTAYFGYHTADPIPSSARDFGGCQLNLNAAKDGFVCHGSPNSNFFQPFSGPNFGNPFAVVGGQLLEWPQASQDPPPAFNSQQFIYMYRGDQRYQAGVLGHIDINEHLNPYAEFGFMTDKTSIKVAASGLFQQNPIDPTGFGDFNVNCDNPLLSAQEVGVLCSPEQIAYVAANPGQGCIFNGSDSPNCANVNIGRRNVEGAQRFSYWNHTNYRMVLGAKGEIADGWSYDAFGQYYETSLFNRNGGYLSFRAITNALQVTTDGAGNPVCISGPPCVPWNIWKQGGVTDAQLQPMYGDGTSDGTSMERALHVDLTGDLGRFGIRSPAAADGVTVNFGAEHRRDSLTFTPDAAELSGDLSGFGGASVAIDNGISVTEEFLELHAPLVQGKAGIKDLLVNGAFRHSNYNLSGGVNTYEFAVQYAPTDDFRFRMGYQHAIRAPNPLELFTPQSYGNIGSPGIDPCAPTFDPATNLLVAATASLAACEHTGVTPAQYGNGGVGGVYTGTIHQCTALQCGQLQGGNINLKPEEGNTVSFGVSFAPRAMPNLTGSIDYYRIDEKNVVGVIPADVILSNCLATGDPTYCSLIVRTSSGSVTGSSVATGGYFVQTNLNTAKAKVAGIDVQLAYKLGLPERWGSLAFLFSGSDMLAAETTSFVGAHTYDCKGLYGTTCQTVNPKWRHNLRATWATPWQLEFSALWRYIGSVSLDTNTTDATLGNGSYDKIDATMSAVSYLDLSASWELAHRLQLRAGLNNLFDRAPPIVSSNVSSSGAANSFPTYDQLGRQVFIGFTAKF